MREEEIEQELENNKVDMVFPTNEGYVKVENIERVQDVIISKSVRVSKLIEESELKGKTFKAEITIKDNVTLILLVAEPAPATSFSPVKSSPKQRIKYKDWEALALSKSKAGTIYKEVVNRILEEYEDDVEPSIKVISQIIREMYGNLKKTSIASYVSMYKSYIRENKLAVEPSSKGQKTNKLYIEESTKHSVKEVKTKTKDLLPMEKVVEIWNLLPDEFEYKQVKAQVPISIMQSTSRIDTANYILKQFLDNPAFECEEISPGVFKKKNL